MQYQEKLEPVAGHATLNAPGNPALPFAQEKSAAACPSAGSMLALTAGDGSMPGQGAKEALDAQQTTAEPDAGKAAQPSLEDFENQAFQAAQARKSSKQVLKRPAGQDSSQQGAGKKQAAAQQAPAAKKLKLGCLRCRGGINGCPQCRNPNYAGLRLTRDEWKAHAAKHGLK